jgi:26S proteasome regulatory subunit N1
VTEAARLALHIGGAQADIDTRLTAAFAACGSDTGLKKQLAYLLGRHHTNHTTGDDEIDALISNRPLPGLFAHLARDMDVVAPKAPEDVYKAHLSGSVRGSAASATDSARENLSATFVSAFVNAGFGTDKLLTPPDSQWVFKNKDHGMMAAAASTGLVHLWDDEQLSALDKFLAADSDWVRAGACLGMGLMCSGTRNLDIDPALALLSGHLEAGTASTHAMRLGALTGLGLAYAGSQREDVAELLLPYVSDPSTSMELAALAGWALGLVFVGSGHEVRGEGARAL